MPSHADPARLRLLPEIRNHTGRAVRPQAAPGITLQGLLSAEDNAAITAFCFFNFVLDVQDCAQVRPYTLLTRAPRSPRPTSAPGQIPPSGRRMSSNV